MLAFLDPEHVDLRAMCRDFTDKEVRPHITRSEADGRLPAEVWRTMGEAGLLGLMTPVEFGGSGRDEVAVAVVAEELARAAGGMAIGAMVSAYMAGTHIVHHGNAEQRRRWLTRIASGESIAAIAVTEPEAGSDVAGISARATRTEGGFTLNGRKTFITNAGLADVMIIGVKTEPVAGHRGITTFLVDIDTPGLSVGEPLPKMGWHSSDTREVVIDDVFVPDSAILGDLNCGFYQIMGAFQLERVVLAAMSVGHAAEALRLATSHVQNRVAFGAPLVTKQAIQHRLALMEIQLDAARLMTYRAAAELRAGHCDASRSVAKAKYHAAVTAAHIVDEAVQLHGGSGFVESDVERHYRDVRILRIGGGTDEVQLNILAKSYGQGV